MIGTATEPETAFDPPPFAQEASDDTPAPGDDSAVREAASTAVAAAPDASEPPPQAEVPFPTPDDDGSAYYWDAATMAPLNATSAVSL